MKWTHRPHEGKVASHLKCSEVGNFNVQWERSSENGKVLEVLFIIMGGAVE